MIGAKVSFLGSLSVTELAEAVNRVEANVRRGVPAAGIMYIEPDVMGTDLPGDPFVPDLPDDHPAAEPHPEPAPRRRRVLRANAD